MGLGARLHCFYGCVTPSASVVWIFIWVVVLVEAGVTFLEKENIALFIYLFILKHIFLTYLMEADVFFSVIVRVQYHGSGSPHFK